MAVERMVYLSDVRVSSEDKKNLPNLFFYACRHTDSGSLPWRGYTLEPRVIVNHYCDVVTNFEVTQITLGNPSAKDYLPMATFFSKYQPTEVESLALLVSLNSAQEVLK